MPDKNEKKENASKFRKKVLIRIGHVIGVILLLGFSYGKILERYADKVVGKVITSLISKSSEKNLSISYEEIKINAFRSEIFIRGLHVINEHKVGPESRNKLEVQLPDLHINATGIWLVWFNDYLKIKEVTLSKPRIRIIGASGGNKSLKFSEELGKMIASLRQQLDILEIDALNIENADFAYNKLSDNTYKELAHIKHLSLSLTDFEWEDDPSKYGDASTEGLSITILDQLIILPDSTYKIHFDTMIFSLSKNMLTFQHVSLNGLDNESTQQLELSRLHFGGIDYKTVYDDNILAVKTLQVEKPSLTIRDRQRQLWENEKKDNRFLRAISDVFDSFRIGDVQLISGHLDMKNEEGESFERLKSDSIHFSLQNFEIAPFSNRPITELVTYDNIDIRLENYLSVKSDSSNKVSCNSLRYNQDDGAISADSLLFQTFKTEDVTALDSVYLLIPDFKLTGFETARYLRTKELKIDSLRISRPTCHILSAHKSPQEKSIAVEEAEVGDFFNNALSRLIINKIKIDQIDFLYKEPKVIDIDINNGDFSMSSIDFDTATTINELISSLFFSSPRVDVVMHAEKTAINLLGLKLDAATKNINVSTFEMRKDENFGAAKNVDITMNYLPVKASDAWSINNFSIDEYSANVVAVGSEESIQRNTGAVFQNPLYLDRISLGKGTIDVRSRSGTFNGNIEKIEVFDLSIEEDIKLSSLVCKTGAVDYTNDNNRLSIEDLSFDSEMGLLKVVDLVMVSQQKSDTLFFNSPSLTAKGVNIHQYLLSQALQLESLQVKDWTLLWSQGDFNVRTNTETASAPVEKKKLMQLSIGNIDLNNGNVKSKGADQLFISEIDLTLDHINIDGSLSYRANPNGFLAASRISGSIRDFRYQNVKEKMLFQDLVLNAHDAVKVKRLEYSTADKRNELSADSLYLKNIAYNDIFFKNEINISEMQVFTPLVKVLISKSDKNESTPKTVNIDKLTVNRADVVVTSANKNSVEITPLDIELVKFHYDSLTDFNKSLIPADSVSLTTRNIRLVTNNEMDEIKIGSINVTKYHRTFSINNIEFNPLYDKAEYMDKTGYETDWIKGSVDNIIVSGVDYLKLLNKNSVDAEYVVINHPVLEVYRDKNLQDSLPNYKELPVAKLLSLENEISIDSMKLNNGDLTYQEVAEKGHLPGVLTFKNLDASIYNVVNTKKEIARNPVLKMTTTSRAMDIPFKANFDFRLDRNDGLFSFSGNIPATPLNKFNQLSEHAAFLKVESGKCKELYFQAIADDSVGYGHMIFHYSNLKVALIDKQTDDTKKLEESLASFIANAFIVKKNNLGIIKPRRGDIYFQRNQQKSIFNYMSKLFTSGLSSSVGLKNYRKEVKHVVKEGYFE